METAIALTGPTELLQQSIVDSNTRFEWLEQLAQSNGRAIQAMLDAQASDRLQRAELQTVITGINETIQRLTTINERVVNLLSSLDSDRPTILRKLDSIENKVNRLLEPMNSDQSQA